MFQKYIELIRSVKSIDHKALVPIAGENVRSWTDRCEAYLLTVIVPQDIEFDGAARFQEIYDILENAKNG